MPLIGSAAARTHLWWRIGLWAAQLVLCLIFGMSAVIKLIQPPEAMVGYGIGYANEIPLWLLRFIGVTELAGALGIILPALTRIVPSLTPLAALGFIAIQVLAIGFHTLRGEIAMTWPINLLLLSFSVFVLWGRTRKAPISPRQTGAGTS